MFSFPEGISLSCCSFPCQGIQEALGLGSAVTLQSGSLGPTPPPDSSPGPKGQHQAFFLSGLWFWATRGLSSPTLLPYVTSLILSLVPDYLSSNSASASASAVCVTLGKSRHLSSSVKWG